MKLLEEKIIKEGKVLPGNILKVGSFLNQKIDTDLLAAMGKEISHLFESDNVTKIMTVESSGIAIAAAAGIFMRVPVIFAKKHKSGNIDGEVYCASSHSFTHGNDYDMIISKEYISSDDNILLVDDFLASGNALCGMLELAKKAGARIAGAAIAIEKGFQGGGDELRAKGIKVRSLALIESMSEEGIVFRA